MNEIRTDDRDHIVNENAQRTKNGKSELTIAIPKKRSCQGERFVMDNKFNVSGE